MGLSMNAPIIELLRNQEYETRFYEIIQKNLSPIVPDYLLADTKQKNGLIQKGIILPTDSGKFCWYIPFIKRALAPEFLRQMICWLEELQQALPNNKSFHICDIQKIITQGTFPELPIIFDQRITFDRAAPFTVAKKFIDLALYLEIPVLEKQTSIQYIWKIVTPGWSHSDVAKLHTEKPVPYEVFLKYLQDPEKRAFLENIPAVQAAKKRLLAEREAQKQQ